MNQRILPLFLKIIGCALLCAGLVAVYYGPLEIYVFYLFSEGGQFSYDGFRVGSFWFAALATMNSGYYVIAALCLPAGIGHLGLRRWTLPLTRLYLWFWFGAGALLTANGFFLLPSLLRLEVERATLLTRLTVGGLAALLLLVALPVCALWFYRRKEVVAAFTAREPHPGWMENYPFPLQALLLLLAIVILVLHLSMFYQAIFPLFGRIQLGRPSAYPIALCVLGAVVLIYGVARLKRWAWWGCLAYFGLLALTSAMTFPRYRFYDIILMMDLPAYEMQFLDKATALHDLQLAGLLVTPLLVALGLAAAARRYLAQPGL